MTTRLRLALLVAPLASACATAPAKPAAPAAPAAAPQVPAIALPEGEEPALRLDARGTQNYECRAKPDAPSEYAWVLAGPEAELFDASGKRVGRHYAGPTWESTEDGSKVAAAVKSRADSPDPDAIPWLLLGATQTSGDGVFSRVKSVQRTDTRGGKAPAGACTAGAAVKVPYAAVYWFSRAK
jgi:hypothetical protein